MVSNLAGKSNISHISYYYIIIVIVQCSKFTPCTLQLYTPTYVHGHIGDCRETAMENVLAEARGVVYWR